MSDGAHRNSSELSNEVPPSGLDDLAIWRELRARFPDGLEGHEAELKPEERAVVERIVAQAKEARWQRR